MTVFIASDHAGLPLKDFLIKQCPTIQWVDLGTHSSTSVDYPDFADELSTKMKVAPNCMGVLICGSGQGMAIRANRYSHIRAALCWDSLVAKLSREHNNANVLCLGARLIPFGTALEIFDTFMKTPFSGGRHQVRVDKLSSSPKP